LILICPKCGQRYAIGEDSILITDESLFEDALKMGAKISLQVPYRRAPELAMYGGSISDDLKKENLQIVRIVKEAVQRGEKRAWSCDKCRMEGNAYKM
jgi:hypothetical protein